MGQKGIFQITKKNEMLKWNHWHNHMKTHRWDASKRNRSTCFFHRWIYGKLVNDKCKTWTFEKLVNSICHAIGVYIYKICKFFTSMLKHITKVIHFIWFKWYCIKLIIMHPCLSSCKEKDKKKTLNLVVKVIPL